MSVGVKGEDVYPQLERGNIVLLLFLRLCNALKRSEREIFAKIMVIKLQKKMIFLHAFFLKVFLKLILNTKKKLFNK